MPHIIALLHSGWGEDGQLGHGNCDDLDVLTKVDGLSGHFVVQVAAGDYHTIVLTSEGSVYTFGDNEDGKTGHGTTEGIQTTPRKVGGCLEGRNKVIYIAAGVEHSACIDENGDIYTWGKEGDGRLGHGNRRTLYSPKRVNGLDGKKCVAVACGECHTLVLSGNGKIYSFGFGRWGQLGHGDTQDRLTPTHIEAPFEGKVIEQVACGRTHSMALSSEGVLYTWGSNKKFKLGHQTRSWYCNVPYPIQSLFRCKIVYIDASNAHSVVLVDPKDSSYFLKMTAMINDESCSDVVIVLKDDNDEQVHVQKSVLIAQSEYFRAMFRNDMREARENVIEVWDCPKNLLLLFLEYLYSGFVDLEDDLEKTMELYELADRYQADALCERCVEAIEKCLNKQNCVSLLVKAYTMGASVDVIKNKIIKRINIETRY